MQAKRLPASAAEDDLDEVSDEDEAADMECDDTVNEEVKKKVNDSKGKAKKHKLSKELSDLVVMCQSVGFKSFEHAKTHRKS
jgi:hypothetical protein